MRPVNLALTSSLLILALPLAAIESGAPGLAFETWVYAQPPNPTPPPSAPTRVESNVPGAGFDAPDTSLPTVKVFSRETIVDVLVTDDKGNPVRGLTRSDFTVAEDNKPQPIRSFYEYDKTTPAAPAPTLPPDTYTNAHTLPPTGPVQIFLIERSVIDSPTGREISVPPALPDYLRTMARGTQVAIFTFSPITGLEMEQGFTSDGVAAASAAARIKPVVDLAPVFKGASTTILHIAALEQIAAYVAGIRGRKNLIWVTSGMPLMVDRDGGYEWPSGAGHDMSIVHRLMDVYQIFSREQIAIYPVDPNGIHGLGFAALRAQEVADQTGGTYDNTNDIKGELAAIVDRSSDSYLLSFIPPRPNEDAHFHTIDIQVDRPGVHLTYRTGYDDDHPRPPDGMLKYDLQQGPMRVGALLATQLLFTLQVTPASPDTSTAQVRVTDKHHAGSPKDRLYNAVFTFDPTQIAFSETPDGKRAAKLEFDLGAFDSYSQLGPVRSQTITLTVNPSGYDDFMRKPFRFTLPIPLATGQRTLRAGLFDTVANKAGTLEIPLTVPPK